MVKTEREMDSRALYYSFIFKIYRKGRERKKLCFVSVLSLRWL